MHAGHRALFDSVFEYRKNHPGVLAGLVTFVHSPGAVKNARTYPGDITTERLKVNYFAQKGFDFCIMIDFSVNFSKIKGIDFLDILRNFCSMQFLAAGYDFRCGHNLDTGVAELSDYCLRNGLELKVVEEILLDGERISSSRIRNAVLNGDFLEAKKLLGYPYTLDCSELRISRGPSEFRLSTIANGKTRQVLPGDGCYPVRVFAGDKIQPVNGMLFVRAESEFLRLEFPPEQNSSSIQTIEKIEFLF